MVRGYCGWHGLIPARAGTTRACSRAARHVGAHPRSRGDHLLPSKHKGKRLGSSPLARGPLSHGLLGAGNRGLIPARAGTTRVRPGRGRVKRAHPRSRGDHRSRNPPLPVFPGSSPLARGPLFDSLPPTRKTGLIPARAGTTLHRYRGTGRTGAHPRSRGDHTSTLKPWIDFEGSSPLARGPHDNS